MVMTRNVSIWFEKQSARSLVAAVGWLLFCVHSLTGCVNFIKTPLDHPTGVAARPDGTMWVTDRGNHRIVRINSSGNVDKVFGKIGSGPADLYRPWDIAVDSAGNIFVCNMVFDIEMFQAHDGVKVYDPDGNYLREIAGRDYDASETMDLPYGIDIDQQDRVYVLYSAISSLKVYESDGDLIYVLDGADSQLPLPLSNMADVAVDDQNHWVYISDQSSSKVVRFELSEKDGKINLIYNRSLGGYGREPGQFAYPSNLAVDDESGNLYVGDMANQRIQLFDPTGEFLTAFSPPGVKTWQVLGLSVAGGKVYAADPFNNCVWVFDLNGNFLVRLEGQK